MGCTQMWLMRNTSCQGITVRKQPAEGQGFSSLVQLLHKGFLLFQRGLPMW